MRLAVVDAQVEDEQPATLEQAASVRVIASALLAGQVLKDIGSNNVAKGTAFCSTNSSGINARNHVHPCVLMIGVRLDEVDERAEAGPYLQHLEPLLRILFEKIRDSEALCKANLVVLLRCGTGLAKTALGHQPSPVRRTVQRSAS